MFSVNKQVDLGTVCDVTKKNIFPTNTKHWSTYFTFCDTKRELMNNTKKKQSYLELTFDHALRDYHDNTTFFWEILFYFRTTC